MSEDELNLPPLTKDKCMPCQGGVPPLKPAEITLLLKQLSPEWQVIDDHHLERQYKFKNFIEALYFVNEVGQLAELFCHHPDIYLAWGKLKLLYGRIRLTACTKTILYWQPE